MNQILGIKWAKIQTVVLEIWLNNHTGIHYAAVYFIVILRASRCFVFKDENDSYIMMPKQIVGYKKITNLLSGLYITNLSLCKNYELTFEVI